jgi:hypothetical protein
VCIPSSLGALFVLVFETFGCCLLLLAGVSAPRLVLLFVGYKQFMLCAAGACLLLLKHVICSKRMFAAVRPAVYAGLRDSSCLASNPRQIWRLQCVRAAYSECSTLCSVSVACYVTTVHKY